MGPSSRSDSTLAVTEDARSYLGTLGTVLGVHVWVIPAPDFSYQISVESRLSWAFFRQVRCPVRRLTFFSEADVVRDWIADAVRSPPADDGWWQWDGPVVALRSARVVTQCYVVSEVPEKLPGFCKQGRLASVDAENGRPSLTRGLVANRVLAIAEMDL